MSGSIKVLLEVGMPAPGQIEKKPEIQKIPVEDQVREALECIDSGHDSAVEWSMINRLYRDLKSLKKPNDRARNLMNMIQPVLEKFGYFEVTNRKA